MRRMVDGRGHGIELQLRSKLRLSAERCGTRDCSLAAVRWYRLVERCGAREALSCWLSWHIVVRTSRWRRTLLCCLRMEYRCRCSPLCCCRGCGDKRGVVFRWRAYSSICIGKSVWMPATSCLMTITLVIPAGICAALLLFGDGRGGRLSMLE